jgi:hypothetical protein
VVSDGMVRGNFQGMAMSMGLSIQSRYHSGVRWEGWKTIVLQIRRPGSHLSTLGCPPFRLLAIASEPALHLLAGLPSKGPLSRQTTRTRQPNNQHPPNPQPSAARMRACGSLREPLILTIGISRAFEWSPSHNPRGFTNGMTWQWENRHPSAVSTLRAVSELDPA